MDTPQMELENNLESGSTEETVTTEETTSAPAVEAQKPTEDENLQAKLESLQKTLSKAEEKIVKLKRGQSEEEEAESIDPQAVKTLIQAEIDERLKNLFPERDETLESLKQANATINELSESLKSRNAVSNSSQGTNQDRYVPEQTIKLSPLDEELAKRYALRNGVDIKEARRRLTKKV